MPEFDLDRALRPDDVHPYCQACGERMVFSSCDTGENETGFSLERICRFGCANRRCEGPSEESVRAMRPYEVNLVVTKVTSDEEPLGRGALHCVSTGRCPWCRSISGPSHNSQHSSEDGGLLLTWDCDDCHGHWEECLGRA